MRPEQRASAIVLAFILMQIVCQVALLFEFIGPLRIVMRSASFSASLAMLVFLPPRRGQVHPAHPWALAVLAVLGLELMHPTGNTMLSRVAQLAMYLAIVGPVFWAGRLAITPLVLRRLMLVLWAFHTLGSAVGVIQVYFPGHLQPNLSSVIQGQGADVVASLQISLADGTPVFRPMGLTDIPGGAAAGGMYAVLFSFGFFLNSRSRALRAAALGSMLLGLFCIYLSQVRSVLIMTGVCVATFAVLLGRRGDVKRFVGIAVVTPLLILVSFSWAVSVGGKAVTDRLGSLIDDRADEVYYKNRGRFLEHTINELLPEHPFGAGLGRWGMMNAYFADNSDPQTTAIWVEIQLTGWLLDGGVPLIVCYTGALGLACLAAYRISIRAGPLGVWAALILAYDVGALALTFNYPVFISQAGLEFWLLNTCLFVAAVHSRRAAMVLRASGTRQKSGPTNSRPALREVTQPA